MGWLAQRNDEVRRRQRVLPLPKEPVEVQIMGLGTLDVLHARNVSRSGLGVYVHHRFEGLDLAMPVELVVTLPGGRPFLAVGVIRHVTEDGAIDAGHFGLEFTALADSARQALSEYVDRRLEDGESA